MDATPDSLQSTNESLILDTTALVAFPNRLVECSSDQPFLTPLGSVNMLGRDSLVPGNLR